MMASEIFDAAKSTTLPNQPQRMEFAQKMRPAEISRNPSRIGKSTPPPPPSGGGSEGGTLAFHGGTVTTQASDIVSKYDGQRRYGESLVNEAHILNHEAMIARTKGDYAAADALQKEANAKQREGHNVLENLGAAAGKTIQSAKEDIAFGSGAGISNVQSATGHWMIVEGNQMISQGQSLISQSYNPDNPSLREKGQRLISEGKAKVNKGKALQDKAKNSQ